ncbi:unnamed protein product [Closterium sp. NIES-65]|nr:unnamed protein product [Closterium sp. NIES-65]
MDGPVVATDDKGLPRIPRFDGKLNAGQVEALWRDFFNDPVQFFDYREMKQHAEVPPKYPDFKKIATGEPLWVESRGTPPWVHECLQKYDDAFAAALAGMPLEGQGGQEGAAGAGVEEQFQEEFGGGAMDAPLARMPLEGQGGEEGATGGEQLQEEFGEGQWTPVGSNQEELRVYAFLWVQSRELPPLGWMIPCRKYDDAFAAALEGMPLEGQGGAEEGAAGGEQFGEN